MIPITSPCKDCTDRSVGCHSTCSKYADYRKQVDAINADRHAMRDSFYGPSDRIVKYNMKHRKRNMSR